MFTIHSCGTAVRHFNSFESREYYLAVLLVVVNEARRRTVVALDVLGLLKLSENRLRKDLAKLNTHLVYRPSQNTTLVAIAYMVHIPKELIPQITP